MPTKYYSCLKYRYQGFEDEDITFTNLFQGVVGDMLVYVSVFLCVGIYTCACVCGDQRLTLVVLLIFSPSPSASLSQGLSVNLEDGDSASLTSQFAPDALSLPPRCCVPNELPHPPGVHMDDEDPSSHRHVCTASTLFMEPSSLWPVINFNLWSEELTQPFSFGSMHTRPYSLESIFPHC